MRKEISQRFITEREENESDGERANTLQTKALNSILRDLDTV